MANDTLRYAGFWPRLGSLLLDIVIVLPLIALVTWAAWHNRLFRLYYVIPDTLFGLFYNVYLVRRFGGTPGKLIVGIRIRKLDGEPVGYRGALLRYSPDLVFGLLMSVAVIIPLFQMTDAEYHSLSLRERAKHEADLAPSWYKPLRWITAGWNCSELVVLLTNRKRRALHDFIAGTVVVYASPNQSLEPTASRCDAQV
jgi:uncharacterized RDD family membrane protein YckC